MKATKGTIIVRVALDQNEEAIIGGKNMKTGRNYNENFRERNPVVAEVIEGCEEVAKGSFVVCNYSLFDEESPNQLYDNLFSIPASEEVFATIDREGQLTPVFGNILVERVTKDSPLPIPEELKKPHVNQGIVANAAEDYTKGEYIFWLEYSDYEIVYYWNGEERRALKVHQSEIVGYLKK